MTLKSTILKRKGLRNPCGFCLSLLVLQSLLGYGLSLSRDPSTNDPATQVLRLGTKALPRHGKIPGMTNSQQQSQPNIFHPEETIGVKSNHPQSNLLHVAHVPALRASGQRSLMGYFFGPKPTDPPTMAPVTAEPSASPSQTLEEIPPPATAPSTSATNNTFTTTSSSSSSHSSHSTSSHSSHSHSHEHATSKPKPNNLGLSVHQEPVGHTATASSSSSSSHPESLTSTHSTEMNGEQHQQQHQTTEEPWHGNEDSTGANTAEPTDTLDDQEYEDSQNEPDNLPSNNVIAAETGMPTTESNEDYAKSPDDGKLNDSPIAEEEEEELYTAQTTSTNSPAIEPSNDVEFPGPSEEEESEYMYEQQNPVSSAEPLQAIPEPETAPEQPTYANPNNEDQPIAEPPAEAAASVVPHSPKPDIIDSQSGTEASHATTEIPEHNNQGATEGSTPAEQGSAIQMETEVPRPQITESQTPAPGPEGKLTNGELRPNSSSSDNSTSSDEEEEFEELEEELAEEEREVRRIGGFGVFLALVAMVFTAHQMSENPDGIYASCCRLIITMSCCGFKMLLMPFRSVVGGGNRGYGHMPVSTMDYGYRDPYRPGSTSMELS